MIKAPPVATDTKPRLRAKEAIALLEAIPTEMLNGLQGLALIFDVLHRQLPGLSDHRGLCDIP